MTEQIYEMEGVAYLLGLKPCEFWSMTHRKFTLWCEKSNERLKHENEKTDYRLAVLLSQITNLLGDGKKQVKPEDFLKKEEKAMNPNIMAEILKAYTLAVGGKVEV